MAETKNKKVEEKIENTPKDTAEPKGIITPEDVDEPMVVEDGVVLTEDKCADHISRTKVLDVIKSTMAKYEGKVVLAMEEVRAIIKAITTAVEE